MSTTRTNHFSAVEEIKDQVIELGRYYALWWYFLEKSNASRYARVESSYPDFFITLADSLRGSFFITAYRFFDKRTDVNSLALLVNRLKVSDPSLAARLRDKMATVADIIENKVTKLRHKVFAHRDRSQDIISTLAGVDA